MTETGKNKEAVLTQKRLKEVLEYNSETGQFIWIARTSPKAYSIKIGQPAGHIDNEGYIRVTINGQRYQAHRLAWLYIHGYFPCNEKNQIDHVDGDRVNNRIENLREVSEAENSRNHRKRSTNKSGTTGVHLDKKCKPSGKTQHYWVAHWYDADGKQHRKHFSVKKFGYTQAESLAITYRAEQIYLLANAYGINYSGRHGN